MKPDYLGPYPDLYVGSQRLWAVFAGANQVWPEMAGARWLITLNDSVYFSQDGLSWELATTFSGDPAAAKYNPTLGSWALPSGADLLSSADGETWSSDDVFAALTIPYHRTDSVREVDGEWYVMVPDLVTVPSNGYLYLFSSSDGVSWSSEQLTLFWFQGNSFLHNPSGDRKFIVFATNRMSHYSDDGVTFTEFDMEPMATSSSLSRSATDFAGTILAWGFLSAHRSADGGETWSNTTIPGYDVYFGDGVFLSSDGYSSTDGDSWTDLMDPAISSRWYDYDDEDQVIEPTVVCYDHEEGRWIILEAVYVYDGTDQVNVVVSDDGGASWELVEGVLSAGDISLLTLSNVSGERPPV